MLWLWCYILIMVTTSQKSSEQAHLASVPFWEVDKRIKHCLAGNLLAIDLLRRGLHGWAAFKQTLNSHDFHRGCAPTVFNRTYKGLNFWLAGNFTRVPKLHMYISNLDLLYYHSEYTIQTPGPFCCPAFYKYVHYLHAVTEHLIFPLPWSYGKLLAGNTYTIH